MAISCTWTGRSKVRVRCSPTPLPGTRQAVVGSPSTALPASNVTRSPAASWLLGAVADARTPTGERTTTSCCPVDSVGCGEGPGSGSTPPSRESPPTRATPRSGRTAEDTATTKATKAVTSPATPCPTPGPRAARVTPSTPTATAAATAPTTTDTCHGRNTAPVRATSPAPEASQPSRPAPPDGADDVAVWPPGGAVVAVLN